MVLGCFSRMAGRMFLMFRRFGVLVCTLPAHLAGEPKLGSLLPGLERPSVFGRIAVSNELGASDCLFVRHRF